MHACIFKKNTYIHPFTLITWYAQTKAFFLSHSKTVLSIAKEWVHSWQSSEVILSAFAHSILQEEHKYKEHSIGWKGLSNMYSRLREYFHTSLFLRGKHVRTSQPTSWELLLQKVNGKRMLLAKNFTVSFWCVHKI